uniref:C2H2-type domain-containing protein n=1 Tax=Octopus bimaculoides TaxID=37653 RepID=A0A0L8GI16_OCTBM
MVLKTGFYFIISLKILHRSLPNNMPNFLDHYAGPYPIHQLVAAQRTLIYGFNNKTSKIFDRIYNIMLRENCRSNAPLNNEVHSPDPRGFQNTLCSSSQLEKKRKAQVDDASLSINIDHQDPPAKSIKLKKSKALENNSLETESSKLIVCYKCDYCDFVSADSTKSIQHLKDEVHKSCSKCKGMFYKKKLKADSVITEVAIQNDGKEFYSKLATCAKCFNVFSDIYSCSRHFIKFHNGKSQPCYAISDVVDFKKLLIPGDSVCQKCGLHCKKQKSLNTHYGQFQHYPFDKPTSSDIRLLFTCPICQKYFYAFLLAKAHILDHGLTKPSMALTLNLAYYKLCDPKVNLLPLTDAKKTEKKTKTKKKKVKVKVKTKKKKKSQPKAD